MIINKKQAKKLKHFGETIDLKYMDCKEYVNKVERKNTKIETMKNYISIAGMIWFVIAILYFWISIPLNDAQASDSTIKNKVRAERLEACQKAYKDSGIQEQFLYEQVPAVRCATYMTLVYAYESKFEGKVGNTQKCLHMNNCWGMKGNGVETPSGFIHFDTLNDGRYYFAKKYFQFHYKKDISKFVFTWSMTDRDTYISFMRGRFWRIYKELELQYLSGQDIL